MLLDSEPIVCFSYIIIRSKDLIMACKSRVIWSPIIFLTSSPTILSCSFCSRQNGLFAVHWIPGKLCALYLIFPLPGLLFQLSIIHDFFSHFCFLPRFSSVTQSCLTLCNPIDCSTPSLPIHHELPELAQTHVHRVDDAIQPCYPLPFPSPSASIFLSIRVFSNELTLDIRWSKYWSFNFTFSPSNEYSGLISFRIDWFYLLAVQGTLKSLL